MSCDSASLHIVNKDIFDATQDTVGAYLYGQIKDMGSFIMISVKLVDAVSGTIVAHSAVKYSSDETTDNLLGKTVQPRSKLTTDSVVIVQENIVKKPVTVKKTSLKSTGKVRSVQYASSFSVEGVNVGVGSFKYSANSLVLSLSLTNYRTDSTKVLTIKDVRIVDSYENDHYCHTMQIANDNYGGDSISCTLEPGEHKLATMTFDDVDFGQTTVNELHITAQNEDFIFSHRHISQ
jgi:hypothetical protein